MYVDIYLFVYIYIYIYIYLYIYIYRHIYLILVGISVIMVKNEEICQVLVVAMLKLLAFSHRVVLLKCL